MNMAQRIVVIGGGAAGIGAAGAAKAVDAAADIRVYTDFEDVGYSPCGIPYVHGREIPDFPGLILQSKEFYEQSGLDIHYTTTVTGVELDRGQVIVAGEGAVPYDSLVLATGFEYEPPGVPGSDLEGLYYVKNIRRAMEWDEILDEAKRAVVVDATPLGLEVATALVHRTIQ